MDSPKISTPEAVNIHQSLAEHAHRHMMSLDGGLGKLVEITDFNPKSEYHDLAKVHFEAKPNMASPAIVGQLAKLVLGSSPKELKTKIDERFKYSMPELEQSIEDGRLMVLTDHEDPFEPMVGAFALQSAAQRSLGIKYDRLAKSTHIMGIRSPAYVKLKHVGIPLLSIARQMGHYHPSLATPGFEKKSDLPSFYLLWYAKALVDEFFESTRSIGSIGILAAPSTNSRLNDQSEKVIQTVKPGINNKIIQRDWDILPLAINRRRGKFDISVGEVIPYEYVDRQTAHEAMEWIAAEKSRFGTPTIYAARD